MKLLVTGGAGYVGSHSVARLQAAGHAVDVLDNLSTGHRAALSNSTPLIVADVLNGPGVDRIIENGGYDAVMHFASHSLVGESMCDPLKFLGDNPAGAVNLLRAMHRHGVRKFVLSSTAALFGDAEEVNITEACAIAPGSAYGESKYQIERILDWADRVLGIRFVALRYFNAAGADVHGERGENHEPETHLIPLVLQVALGKREDIAIFGSDYPTPDGTCIRDYIHVSDLASAHLLALASLENGSRHFNLGTGTGHSVLEVIETARAVTGRAIPARVVGRRDGDPARLVASSQRISDELGWTPKHSSLRHIIETAWRWHRANPEGYGKSKHPTQLWA